MGGVQGGCAGDFVFANGSAEESVVEGVQILTTALTRLGDGKIGGGDGEVEIG